MKLTNLIYQGMQRKWQEKRESELRATGTYRGGNTGILVDGTSAGQCIRKALARSLGHYDETDWDTQLMYDVGEINEDRWDKYLKLAGVDVRTGSEATKWLTDAGTPVTGSPDAVIYENGEPVLGIEHKHVSSMGTALAAIGGEPKLDNLAQAGHYSMAMGIPFILVYTSSTAVEGTDWKMKNAAIPKPGQLYSEFCNYTYYRYNGRTRKGRNGKVVKEKTKIITHPTEDADLLPSEVMKKYDGDLAELKSFRPFVIEYPLRWQEDVLQYEHGGKWISSLVTRENIRAYYNQIDVMKRNRELGPRPYNLKADGSSMAWSPCDYCKLKSNCDNAERDYGTWISNLTKLGD